MEYSFLNFLISVMLFPFLSLPCLTLIVTPTSIFYPALAGEFLRIAHSSLLYKNFHEKAMVLTNRMKA